MASRAWFRFGVCVYKELLESSKGSETHRYLYIYGSELLQLLSRFQSYRHCLLNGSLNCSDCRYISTSSITRIYSENNSNFIAGYKDLQWLQITKRIYILKSQNLISISANNKIVRADSHKPIAILMPWVNAKVQHLARFATLYADQGHDVIVVLMNAMDIFPPKYGTHVTCRHLIEILHTADSGLSAFDHVLFHCFSAGCYVFGELIAHLELMDMQRCVTDRIRGVIFDSTMTYDHAVTALPRGLTSSKFLQALVGNFTRLGFAVAGTEQALVRAQDRLVNYLVPMKAAGFIWSDNDPVSSASDFRQIGDVFQERGTRMFYQSWSESKHCSHLFIHPRDYLYTMRQYMAHVGILHAEHLLCAGRLRLALK